MSYAISTNVIQACYEILLTGYYSSKAFTNFDNAE